MNQPKDIVYDPTRTSFEEMMECQRSNCQVLCHLCGAPFIIALDPKTCVRHPGIYCSQDSRHFGILYEPARPPDYWETFAERVRLLEEEKSKSGKI